MPRSFTQIAHRRIAKNAALLMEFLLTLAPNLQEKTFPKRKHEGGWWQATNLQKTPQHADAGLWHCSIRGWLAKPLYQNPFRSASRKKTRMKIDRSLLR